MSIMNRAIRLPQSAPVVDEKLPSGDLLIIMGWPALMIAVFIYCMALIQAVQVSKSRQGAIILIAIVLMWLIYVFVGLCIFVLTVTLIQATKLILKTDNLRDDDATETVQLDAPVVDEKLQLSSEIIMGWFVLATVVFIYSMAFIQAVQLSMSMPQAEIATFVLMMWYIYGFAGLFICILTVAVIQQTKDYIEATKLIRKTDNLSDHHDATNMSTDTDCGC